jgi:RNA polymerase sigma factor (TIGR02999 family)
VCFRAPPQGGSPAANLHYTLRKRAGKTVMPFRNRGLANRLQPDELSKTPEERRSLDQLFSVTYEELRRLASSVRRSHPGATISPTTMVNEAWVKLAKSPRFASTSQLHFKRIAARAMRQVLVEAARRRNASKRGGGEGFALITFDESQQQTASCGQDLLALDSALEELARIEPRQAMMVESRFFGGLDINEIASLLAVSEATILRDWRAAKAWLAHELRRAS